MMATRRTVAAVVRFVCNKILLRSFLTTYITKNALSFTSQKFFQLLQPCCQEGQYFYAEKRHYLLQDVFS